MRVTSIHRIKLSTKSHLPLLDTLAKTGLHRLLAGLERGRLILEDSGGSQAFGQPAEQAPLVASLRIHDPAAYRDLLFGGSIGAGESYMAGLWSTHDLVKLVRLMALNMPVVARMDDGRSLIHKTSASVFHWLNRNTRAGASRNIAAHYDLGNEFFARMLDAQMMYSSAIFPSADASLEEASVHKLDTLCRKLRLTPNDHLLEIGTGWGGMAVYAAKHYGCRVTTTTLSRAQYEHAKAWIAREGLQHRVSLLLEDYRDLEGAYDKLVSVEMIEAVGHEYYDTYFRRCSALLKPHGIMALQAITIPDQRYQAAKDSVDFIQKYIFPGGSIPSIEVIARHVARQTDMQIVALEDITSHYARTLEAWRGRFLSERDAIKRQGFEDAFLRMWEFYLCYCEGSFRERVISTAQFVLAKPNARFA